MALSVYKIGEHHSNPNFGEGKGLDQLLRDYNSVINTSALGTAGFIVKLGINELLFGTDTLVANNAKIHFQYDSSTSGNVATDSFNTTLGGGNSLFLENANNGAGNLVFTTDNRSDVILLGPNNAVNFVDAGSTGDGGDYVIGSGDVRQNIWVTQGNNTVLAGQGMDFIHGGSGNDSLIAGGATTIQAGSGSQTLVGGLFSNAKDVLKAGSGTDLLRVKDGNNTIYAGGAANHGIDTVRSGDKGADSIVLNNGGNVSVVIGAGSGTDVVSYGAHSGNDTITTSGNVDIHVQTTEVISGVDTQGGITIVTFKDGQTLQYSGTGHVNLTFNNN